MKTRIFFILSIPFILFVTSQNVQSEEVTSDEVLARISKLELLVSQLETSTQKIEDEEVKIKEELASLRIWINRRR